jgi:hypothetical protein
VLAQEPSGKPDTAGQRFEVPEFGYAVNLPADWVGIDSSDPDVAALLAGVVDQLQGPEAVARLEDLLSQMAGPVASGAQVAATPLHEPDTLFCGVEARSGPAGPLGAWVERVKANAEAGRSGFVVETGPQAIELPSGAPWVLDGTLGDPATESGAYMTMYMLGGDGLELGVSCFGYERPGDDWLRFAESIEFLPAASRPVVIGGRIEIPTAGFAIEVPDGWMGADLSHPDLVPQLESTGETGAWLVDALDGHLGSSFEDRVALGHEMVLWASRAGEGAENRQHCEAYVLKTVLTSIGQFVELYSSHAKDDPSQKWERLDLPAGEAARNDYQWSPTSFGSDYTFFDGRRFVTLSCVQGMCATAARQRAVEMRQQEAGAEADQPGADERDREGRRGGDTGDGGDQ